MTDKKLKSITIIGLGLLGGSLGLAIHRAFPTVRRLGYSHRKSTREKALKAQAVDEVFDSLEKAVKESFLIVFCTPVGVFDELFREIAGFLPKNCVITDVGSTKVDVVRSAQKIFPKHVEFIGSHPIAGSEQRGIEFSRADLFDHAKCIITPTAKTTRKNQTLVSQFWKKIGMQVSTMTPQEHDRLLARISHLPHVLAMTLVNSLDPKETQLCGKGFMDTTRIASGDPGMWRDILMSNAKQTDQAITQLIKELTRTQKALRGQDDQTIFDMLAQAQQQRNKLVAAKLRRKELPA